MARKGFSNGFGNGFGGSRSLGYLQIVIPGATLSYEDGDIMSAVNHRALRTMAANQAMFTRTNTRRLARLNSAGLLPSDDVIRDAEEETRQYRIERLSATTAKIVRLSDLAEIEFTTNTKFIGFSGREESMDIELYFRRKAQSLARQNAQGQPMFGTSINNAVIYGGRTIIDHTKLDTVWTQIETKLGVTEDSIPYRPFNRRSYQKYLIISVNDFPDDAGLTSQLIDEETGETIKKRKNYINWRQLRDVIEADVLDLKRPVQIDNIRKHVRQEIVLEKSV